MGQYFELVDVDGQEAYAHGGGMKLGEFFWSSSIGRLFQLLTRMPSPCAGMSSGIWPCAEVVPSGSTGTNEETSKLLSLPNELILATFKKLTWLEDAISLALAHDTLGAIGESTIRKRLATELAPWAGHRLICFGDYTEDKDFPPSIQPLIWEQLGIDPGALDPKAYSSHFSGFAYDYRRRGTSRKGQWHTVIHNLNLVFEDAIELSESDKQTYRKFVANLKALPVDTTYASQSNLVLCNLSKHEYVRGSEVEEAFQGRLTLGHVLLSQIGWSSDPSVNGMGWSSYQSLTRGKWAGDKFEVVKPDEMQAGVEWKDITDGSIAHLSELWSDADY